MVKSASLWGSLPRSEEPQIFPLLPVGNRLMEAIPLVLLMQRVKPVHGVAKGVLGKQIGGEAGDRLIEVARQRLHLQLITLGRRQLVEGLGQRRAGVEPFADALERSSTS